MSKDGIKFDQGKPMMRLLPWGALTKVAEVLTHGANKYTADNWKKVKPFEERYQDAALRHLFAYQAGDLVDSESGFTHLAHAITNLLFLLEMEGGKECQPIITPVTSVTQEIRKTNSMKLVGGTMTWNGPLNVRSVTNDLNEYTPLQEYTLVDQDLLDEV